MRGDPRSRRFTEAQREACWRLRLEGFTYEDAREHLRTVGYGRLEPFEISVPSIRRYAKELAELREPSTGTDLAAAEPTRAIHVLVAEAVRLAQLRTDRIRRLQKAGQLTDDRLRAHMKMLREAQALTAKLPVTKPKQDSEEQAGAELAELDWLEEGEADEAKPKRKRRPPQPTSAARKLSVVPTISEDVDVASPAGVDPASAAERQSIEPS